MRRTRSSIQSVIGHPVAAPDSAAMHHGVLPSALIFCVRASRSSSVFGRRETGGLERRPVGPQDALDADLVGQAVDLAVRARARLRRGRGRASPCRWRRWRRRRGRACFCLARSHMRPGWGSSPTSGGLPPCTRVRISVSHERRLGELDGDVVLAAHAETSALKPGSRVRAEAVHDLDRCSCPGRSRCRHRRAVPELDDRHPEARPATPSPDDRGEVVLRLIIPAPPWRVGGIRWPQADRSR